VLDISNNRVFGNFSSISRLNNLRALLISNISIYSAYNITRSGSGWVSISISFAGEADVAEFSGYLAQLTNLETLGISSNDLFYIDFVSGMTRLQHFIAQDNYIYDVSPLAELPELILIDLRRNAIANWEPLGEMKDTVIFGRMQ